MHVSFNRFTIDAKLTFFLLSLPLSNQANQQLDCKMRKFFIWLFSALCYDVVGLWWNSFRLNFDKLSQVASPTWPPRHIRTYIIVIWSSPKIAKFSSFHVYWKKRPSNERRGEAGIWAQALELIIVTCCGGAISVGISFPKIELLLSSPRRSLSVVVFLAWRP